MYALSLSIGIAAVALCLYLARSCYRVWRETGLVAFRRHGHGWVAFALLALVGLVWLIAEFSLDRFSDISRLTLVPGRGVMAYAVMVAWAVAVALHASALGRALCAEFATYIVGFDKLIRSTHFGRALARLGLVPVATAEDRSLRPGPTSVPRLPGLIVMLMFVAILTWNTVMQYSFWLYPLLKRGISSTDIWTLPIALLLVAPLATLLFAGIYLYFVVLFCRETGNTAPPASTAGEGEDQAG